MIVLQNVKKQNVKKQNVEKQNVELQTSNYKRRITTRRITKRQIINRVFDEISFCENFAKLAKKRFSCFAKTRDEFREFLKFRETAKVTKQTSFAKHENRKNEELKVKI
jgi:hypothetical protein